MKNFRTAVKPVMMTDDHVTEKNNSGCGRRDNGDEDGDMIMGNANGKHSDVNGHYRGDVDV